MKHTWTKIAPETDGEGGHGLDVAEMWEWCIRCGCMKLGDDVFVPGIDQTHIIREDIEDPGCFGKTTLECIKNWRDK